MDAPSWLDQVLATPHLGVTTQAWVGFGGVVWPMLDKLNEKWAGTPGGALHIKATGPLQIRVERDSGLYLDLSPTGVVAGYRHQASFVDEPGALPSVSFPEVEPFSALVAIVASVVRDVLSTSGGPSKRSIVRIGFVADCRIVESEAPPGIAAHLKRLDEVLGSPLLAVNNTSLVELSRDGDSIDQCHHGAVLNRADTPGDLRIRLDWQRRWLEPFSMGTADLVRQSESVARAACKYFDGFGNGEHDSER